MACHLPMRLESSDEERHAGDAGIEDCCLPWEGSPGQYS